MADAIDISIITKATLAANQIFYGQYPFLKDLMNKYVGGEKNLELYHVDLVADSITNSLAQLAAPTNPVFNFAAPLQLYLVSDAAGDVSKKIDIIGEKADGSYGQFTLTSDDTDGTTPVDEGLWHFIAAVIKNDAWAGNAILDVDGAGGTNYWTAALGATQTTGIMVVPTGYKGAIITTSSWLLAAPANVNAADRFEIGDDYGWSLNSYNPKYDETPQKYKHLQTAGEQITFSGEYTGAAETDAAVEMYIAIWED